MRLVAVLVLPRFGRAAGRCGHARQRCRSRCRTRGRGGASTTGSSIGLGLQRADGAIGGRAQLVDALAGLGALGGQFLPGRGHFLLRLRRLLLLATLHLADLRVRVAALPLVPLDLRLGRRVLALPASTADAVRVVAVRRVDVRVVLRVAVAQVAHDVGGGCARSRVTRKK